MVRRAHRFSYHGRDLTLREIAKDAGLNLWTLRSRLSRGWTIERAATTSTIDPSECGRLGRAKSGWIGS